MRERAVHVAGQVAGTMALVTLALAGCSSSRLDSAPSFALNDPPSARSSPMLRPQASLSRSSVGAGPGDALRSDGNGRSDTDYARSEYRSDYTPPRPNTDSDVRVAALPPPPSTVADAPSYGSPAYGGPADAPPLRRDVTPVATPSTAAGSGTGSGETIVVQPGDSLFGLSKRHNVSVEALTSANGLSSATLQPGQTLRLPAKTTARKPLQRTERSETVAATSPAIGSSRAQQPLPPVSAEAAAKYTGSYAVQKGDSIYGLAMRMNVPMAELQQVNGIADVHKVKPGTVLKVPGSAVAGVAPAAIPTPVTASPTVAGAGKLPPAVAQRESAAATATAGGTGLRPVLLNPERSAAAPPPTGTQPVTSDALPPSVEAKSPSKGTDVAAAGTATAGLAPDVKLRWPAKGKVIGNYGPRADGTHNDGINISVPQGTDVHSAEAGVVAYAGSELKGYGNLVLVRHENGWITAYAHNSELIAKRGDRVKRGQVIAKAGMTGSVDKPQVHFELRQGSKPVDPMPFMERP